MKRNNKGFTLIELLVVMAIIAILIALAVVGLTEAQATQRDTARRDISGQINSALQTYLDNNGQYPSPSSFTPGFMGGLDAGSCTGNEFPVNGVCVGLDGLSSVTINSSATACNTAPTGSPGTALVLCYEQPASGTHAADGYMLGVQLETQSGAWYFVSP